MPGDVTIRRLIGFDDSSNAGAIPANIGVGLVVGASLGASSIINIGTFAFGSIQVIGNPGAANVTVYGVNRPGDTFIALYDNTGTAVIIPSVASGVWQLPDACFSCAQIKLVTAGSAFNVYFLGKT